MTTQTFEPDEITKPCAGCGKDVLVESPDFCIACELYGPPGERRHAVEDQYAEPGAVNWFGDTPDDS